MVDRERTATQWLQQARHWVEEGVCDAALPSIERSFQLSPTADARWLRDVILDALREAGTSA